LNEPPSSGRGPLATEAPLQPPRPSRNAADSHAWLARVIAEKDLHALPDVSRADVEEAVDRAVRDESCRMESTIAEVRLALLGLGLVLAGAGAIRTADRAMSLLVAAILIVWGAAGAGLLIALKRGAYRRWMRQMVPLVDALMLAILFAAMAADRPVPAFLVAAAAGAAVTLAFLGPTRLSRSASRSSPVAAFAMWAFVSLTASVPWIQVVGVAALIVAASHVGFRMTRGVRRLIAEQVRSVRLAQMYDSAQEALDAREQVLGIVCHDLRTPLTTIVATAGLLLEIPVAEKEREEHLRVVQRVTGHMDRLIHDLLDVSRIEAGTLRVTPVSCPLAPILEAVDEIMGPLCEEKGITLAVDPVSESRLVMADGERIQQVLANLIGNALKFSREGTTIRVGVRDDAGKIRISVIDQGPGIPAEDLDQLWKRLWQATPGDRRGLGLGLSIAKSIVEAHREEVGVESELGVGSEFWFTLARG
jgi:signal transduction histidine kinase